MRLMPLAVLAFSLIFVSSPAFAGRHVKSHKAQPTTSAAPSATGYCTIASRCASMVIDGGSGAVLAAQEPDKSVHPASLTKMMTLYLLFEAMQDGRFSLTDRIPISANAAAQAPSKIGLRPGDSITVEDAIEAIAVKSANDIAMAVAEAVGGSESGFVRRMNAKAAQLGMKNTSFQNPSGLPDPNQRITARDVVTLARRTLTDFPSRRHYFGLSSAMIAGKRVPGHNRLLKSGDCTGGKTGYINASGYNLVAWKEQNDRIVIGAVFGGNTIGSRDRKMAELLRTSLDRATPMKIAPNPIMEAGLEIPLPEPRPETKTGANTGTDTKSVESLIDEAEPDSESEAVEQTLSLATLTATAPTFDESWAIQVGAYRDVAQAQQALAQATRALPVLLGSAFPRTIATATTTGQLHRAQLIGLDERSAKAACTALTKQGMQCLAMPPGQPS